LLNFRPKTKKAQQLSRRHNRNESAIKRLRPHFLGSIRGAGRHPPPVVDALSTAMRTIAANETLQKRFLVAGARCLSCTPKEALAFAAKERRPGKTWSRSPAPRSSDAPDVGLGPRG
jgi:hypothetical protein